MNITPMGGSTPLPKTVAAPAAETSAEPQEQVQVGQQPTREDAIALLQQMAQARNELGAKFIGEVLEPAPPEFQAVSQATMGMREAIAQQMAEQTGAPADPFFLLANETSLLSQAAVNTEKRADFRSEQGQTPNRESLLNEELGYLIETGIYNELINQGAIDAQAIQQAVHQLDPQGEALLTAGTLLAEIRKHAAPELAQQVSQAAAQNPLMQAFGGNPELRQKFAGALDQNFQAAQQVAQGCLGYFTLMGQIAANEMNAINFLNANPPQA